MLSYLFNHKAGCLEPNLIPRNVHLTHHRIFDDCWHQMRSWLIT